MRVSLWDSHPFPGAKGLSEQARLMRRERLSRSIAYASGLSRSVDCSRAHLAEGGHWAEGPLTSYGFGFGDLWPRAFANLPPS